MNSRTHPPLEDPSAPERGVSRPLGASHRNILVIRGGAIGDFILTLPVFSALRQRFPEARLEVLGYPHIVQLALAGGLVDAVRPIESRELAAAFAPDALLAPRLVEYFSNFDLILSYLYDPERVFQHNVARVSSARFLAGPHRPDPHGDRHATEVFLDPLVPLGAVGTDPVPQLRLQPDAVPEPGMANALPPARPSGARRLALHPGSGSERKNWPESGWTELLSRLATELDWDLLLVGGEVEGDRLDRLAGLWPPSRLEVARSLPLVRLARRLTTCQFFVGHDSGITHLAAALGLPGLVLWGESPFPVWHPRPAAMQYLHAGAGLAQLEVGKVWTALVARLR